jgi:hypothetical protein
MVDLDKAEMFAAIKDMRDKMLQQNNSPKKPFSVSSLF